MTEEISGQELVRAVMRKTGISSPTKLAEALALEGRHTVQRVTRWRDGGNGPDTQGTLALLKLGGWLKERDLQEEVASLRAEAAADAATRLGASARRAATRPPSRQDRETG